MNYVGIDVHKRYSVCAAQDEQGRELGVVRIEGNSSRGFAQFLRQFHGPAKVTLGRAGTGARSSTRWRTWPRWMKWSWPTR